MKEIILWIYVSVSVSVRHKLTVFSRSGLLQIRQINDPNDWTQSESKLKSTNHLPIVVQSFSCSPHFGIPHPVKTKGKTKTKLNE